MLKANPFNWVSIPAADIDRAVAFYNAVFRLKLQKVDMHGEPIAFFDMDPESYGAAGAITLGPTHPGIEGPIPFFGCADDLQATLDRVEAAGGTELSGKTAIGENGFIAFFRDSEGNKIGLHSEV